MRYEKEPLPDWNVDQFAQHYVETLNRQPNAYGQHISPIFGQSHHVLIAAKDKFDGKTVDLAVDKAMREAGLKP